MNLTTDQWMISFHSMRNTPKLSYNCVIYKTCLNRQRGFSYIDMNIHLEA